MNTLGRVFREHLAESKRLVEQEFGIGLGKLGAYPLWQFDIREFRWEYEGFLYNIKSFFEEASWSFSEWRYPSNYVAAHAGSKGVYYNSHVNGKLYSEVIARVYLFHELYHRAIIKYAGHDDIFYNDFDLDLCELVDESFAEYMALRIMRRRFGYEGESMIRSLEVAWLGHELKARKVPDNPRSIADFALKLGGDAYGAIDSYEQYKKANYLSPVERKG